MTYLGSCGIQHYSSNESCRGDERWSWGYGWVSWSPGLVPNRLRPFNRQERIDHPLWMRIRLSVDDEDALNGSVTIVRRGGVVGDVWRGVDGGRRRSRPPAVSKKFVNESEKKKGNARKRGVTSFLWAVNFRLKGAAFLLQRLDVGCRGVGNLLKTQKLWERQASRHFRILSWAWYKRKKARLSLVWNKKRTF